MGLLGNAIARLLLKKPSIKLKPIEVVRGGREEWDFMRTRVEGDEESALMELLMKRQGIKFCRSARAINALNAAITDGTFFIAFSQVRLGYIV